MRINLKEKIPSTFIVYYWYRRNVKSINTGAFLLGVGSLGSAGVSCASALPYTMGFILLSILCFIIYSHSEKEVPMPDWITLMERINNFNQHLSDKESLLKDLLDPNKSQAIEDYTAEASYDTWKVEMLTRERNELVMRVDASDNSFIPLFSLLVKKDSNYYLIKYFCLKYINGEDGIQFVISDQSDSWTKAFLQEDRKHYKEIYGKEPA